MLPTELFKLRSLSHLGLVCQSASQSPTPRQKVSWAVPEQDAGEKHSARLESEFLGHQVQEHFEGPGHGYLGIHHMLQGDPGNFI